MRNKVSPKKKFGQHFLENEAILTKIVEASFIQPKNQVIEIGAGTGNLTYFLAQTGASILAIEKDRDLLERLNKRFKRFRNVKIIAQDARFFNLDTLGEYIVVGNIPYNISSFIIRRLLTTENQPKKIIIMLQKEVADKIVAHPGSSQRSLLTILVKMCAKAKILFYVDRKEFSPAPAVDSAVIEIIPERKWGDAEKLFKFIKIGFSAKRRQLINNLRPLYKNKEMLYNLFKESKIKPTLRAEDLSMRDWRNLFNKYNKIANKHKWHVTNNQAN